MLNRMILILALTAASLGLFAQDAAPAADAADTQVYPVAILPFSERGPGMNGIGQNVADVLFAALVANPHLYLVDRQELDKLLSEAELSLSGAVNAGQAIQIGQLTGARILVTGSVFKAGSNVYVVAKVIGTETSKVLGQSVKGAEAPEVLAERLGNQLNTLISEKASTLVARAPKPEERLAALKQKLGDKKLPTTWVNIRETHISRPAVDPAAETEFIRFYRAMDGMVLDKDRADPAEAEYRIVGEGFSEFAARIRNLVSVKARLEVKVLNKQGEVVAIDRQTTVKVDLNEMGAGKAALQEAAAQIAERLLPKLAQ